MLSNSLHHPSLPTLYKWGQQVRGVWQGQDSWPPWPIHAGHPLTALTSWWPERQVAQTWVPGSGRLEDCNSILPTAQSVEKQWCDLCCYRKCLIYNIAPQLNDEIILKDYLRKFDIKYTNGVIYQWLRGDRKHELCYKVGTVYTMV